MEFYCSNNALPNILYIASLLHLHLHSTRMAQLFVFFSSPLSISNHIFIYSTSSHIFPNNSHLLFLWPTLSPIFFLFHPSSSYTVCIDNISKYIIVWKPTLVNSIKSIKSSALIIILCRYFRIGMINWRCHGTCFSLQKQSPGLQFISWHFRHDWMSFVLFQKFLSDVFGLIFPHKERAFFSISVRRTRVEFFVVRPTGKQQRRS